MKKFADCKTLILTALIILAIGGSQAAGQKRRPTSGGKTAAKAKTTAASTAASAASIKEGSKLIGNQIRNLAQFMLVYGGSLTRIETIDSEAKQKPLSDDARRQSDAGKQGLVLTVRTFKNAMLSLEDKFRANAALKPYLLQLTGVGETAATAEEQAAAGQYNQAARTLLEVVGQLTDTLQAMP